MIAGALKLIHTNIPQTVYHSQAVGGPWGMKENPHSFEVFIRHENLVYLGSSKIIRNAM